MKLRSRLRFIVGSGIVLAAVAYVGARARATAPSSVPVTFSGYLQNNGTALTGPHQIAFDLWDDASATDSSFHVCTMAAMPVTIAADGFFSLPLSTPCIAAFPTHNTLWYQFTVDGVAFARVPIGSVPFANYAAVAGNLVQSGTAVGPDGGTVGSYATTLFGSVCGVTPATSGAFADGTYGTRGLGAAKTMCQTACGSATAHICYADDLKRAAKLLGAELVTGAGWVEASAGGYGINCGDPTIPCRSSGGPNPNAIDYIFGQDDYGCMPIIAGETTPAMGTTYAPAGAQQTPCSTQVPILCCD